MRELFAGTCLTVVGSAGNDHGPAHMLVDLEFFISSLQRIAFYNRAGECLLRSLIGLPYEKKVKQ